MPESKPLSEWRNWEKSDLEAFLQSYQAQEGFEIECKGAIPFQKQNLTDKEKLDNFSCPVSAFANTRGGLLFLGVEEDESKPPMYFVEDAIPKKLYAKNRIIDILNSCTNPNYSDCEVKEIGWSEGASIYICQIPEFRVTPIQSKDLRFYIRTQNGKTPAWENIVRALYFKARDPDICLSLSAVEREKYFEAKQVTYNIQTDIVNRGTVRATAVKIQYTLTNVSMMTPGTNREKFYQKFSCEHIFPNLAYPGPFFPNEPGKLTLESRTGLSLEIIANYGRVSETDEYSLEGFRDSGIEYVIYADDAPLKKDRVMLRDILPNKISWEIFSHSRGPAKGNNNEEG